MSKKIKYSEIFYSFQGEGFHCGAPTVWLRTFGCNLECNGFGQDYPTRPHTWDLPFKTFDITPIQDLASLPVWDKGCDSSYSWSNKYKHLSPKADVSEIADKLIDLLPSNKFDRRDSIHLAITGGEPMLWQDSIIELIDEFIDRGNYPTNITIETNGTIELSPELKSKIRFWAEELGIDWFWSVSPKLYNVSGEKDAVNFEVINGYFSALAWGQIKFVLNNSDAAWAEVDEKADVLYSDSYLGGMTHCAGVPIFVMPVGATVESQTGTVNSDLGKIADKAIARGWRVSGRVHANIYGNAIAK